MNRLLRKKSLIIERHGYCEFVEHDWYALSIDISQIERLIEEKARLRRCSYALDERRLCRSVAVGGCDRKQFRFYSKAECPTKSDIILQDYDERVGQCVPILGLVEIMRALGPKSLMCAATLRYCVEIFSRRQAVVSDLPPHEDGVGGLFFLILSNSMIGGEMKIYERRVERVLQRKEVDAVATCFYSEPEVRLIRTIPCKTGCGYFVHEGKPRERPLLHGCNRWCQPPQGDGSRTYLRMTFSHK